MDPITIDLSTVVDVISGLGALGFLIVAVYMFMRGDIVPRRVYEMWTESIIHRTVEKLLRELGLTKE